MNIAETVQLFTPADAVGQVPLLIGAHGLGKTEAVKQYAAENNLHCEILMLSLLDVGDLLGLPYRDDVSTKWARPVWFTRIMEAHERGQRSVLFLDELNRAANDVIGASLQLILDRRLNEHQLPLDTFLVAAINPDDGDYNVNTLDPAMLDRLIVCRIEADAAAWLKYAKASNVNPTIIDFITKTPKYLHHTPKDGGKGTSPRSWTRLSKYINYCETNKVDINTYYIKGTIGDTLAAEFILFYNNYIRHLTVEDIVAHYNKSSKRVKDLAKLEASMSKLIEPLEAIQKLDLAESLYKHFSNSTDNAERMPYLVYLYALPVETLAGYLKTFKSDNPEGFKSLVDLDAAVNNKELIRRIVSVSSV